MSLTAVESASVNTSITITAVYAGHAETPNEERPPHCYVRYTVIKQVNWTAMAMHARSLFNSKKVLATKDIRQAPA